MNCPRCGKPLAAGASFCMHCGQMVAATPAPAAHGTGAMPAYAPAAIPMSADARKRTTWLAIGVSAAILLLLFFGLKASGVLNMGGKLPNSASLSASGQVPNTMLQQPGQRGPSSLQATRVTMPKDLYDWLEHLARCEKKKQALTGSETRELQQLKSALTGAEGLTNPGDVDNMSDPDYNSFPTLDKVTAVVNRIQPDWEALKKEFDSVPPPEECKPIAKAYDNALSNIIDTFGAVSGIVENVHLNDQGNIKSSADEEQKIGLHHERGIDGQFQETDDLVQQICDKYQTRKWFKIDAHGGGGILSF